jgi:predicted RNA-binding Zn ribbon-like protein
MAKEKPGSNGKDGFLFVGNHLALDFLNTRPVQGGEPVELLPDFGAVLRWFRAAGLLSSRQAHSLQVEWGQSAQAQRTVEAVRQLRERLGQEILNWEDGRNVGPSTVEGLNRLMAEHPMRTRLKRTASGLATEQYFEARQPQDLLAPLAQYAAALFGSVGRQRVRKCEQCVLHFYDRSKKGTRRWCSMQLCGNRLKVAAYAARRRQQLNER